MSYDEFRLFLDESSEREPTWLERLQAAARVTPAERQRALKAIFKEPEPEDYFEKFGDVCTWAAGRQFAKPARPNQVFTASGNRLNTGDRARGDEALPVADFLGLESAPAPTFAKGEMLPPGRIAITPRGLENLSTAEILLRASRQMAGERAAFARQLASRALEMEGV